MLRTQKLNEQVSTKEKRLARGASLFNAETKRTLDEVIGC
jgi:hypothetical protein